MSPRIDGSMYGMVKALYDFTESCIDINGELSDWFTTFQGVRQGDNLSPTLFSIYINDLAEHIKDEVRYTSRKLKNTNSALWGWYSTP